MHRIAAAVGATKSAQPKDFGPNLLLWILIALLTAAAILAVLRAARARAGRGAMRPRMRARVYRDQLDELERDKAEGRISAGEAEAARAEIARRLIAADGEAQASRAATPAARQRRRRAARRRLSRSSAFPLLSLALYLGARRAEPARRSRSPRAFPSRLRPTTSRRWSRRSRRILRRNPRTAAAGR